MAATTLERLQEFTAALTGRATVDAERGVISDVKLVGLNSLNGRSYSESALRNAASLYEGAKVNVDHRDKASAARSYRDRIGRISGVYFKEGEGLYAKEFHFNPKHALAEQLLWDAQNDPKAVSFSHDADGQVRRSKGKAVVESIVKVNCVDLVADGATTQGLHESEVHMEKTTLRKLIEASGYKHTKKLLEMLPGEVTPEEPIDAPTEKTDPVGAVTQALGDEARAIFVDPEIDTKETIKKIGELAKAQEVVAKKLNPEAAMDEAPPAAPPTESDADKPVEALRREIGALTESLRTLQQRSDARDILAAKGAPFNEQLVDELLECADRSAMQRLVEGWSPQKLGRTKPPQLPLHEASGTYPAKYEDFIRQLKRR